MIRLLLATSFVFGMAAAAPAHASEAQVMPLVAASQHSPVTAVDDAPAGGKKWFAFMPPEGLKPVLEEKKILMIIVGFLFNSIGGNIWGPMVFAGAGFDMEWALPSIVWLAVEWVAIVTGCFVVVTWIIGPIAAWIGTMTTLANLNRPEIALGAKK